MAAKVGGGIAVAAMAAMTVLLVWPMDTGRYSDVEMSGELHDRAGRLLHPYLNTGEQWCFFRPLDEISPRLVAATVAAEDQRFWSHPGVDPVAVARALVQNATRGVMSGASTLTMQVVKWAEQRERSMAAKATQAIQALRLEARVDKSKVLETYLNKAPYGLNLVGCEAAARRYFGKTARELTLPEAALLAALPKAPTGLMPLDHPQAARARRDYVLERMLAEAFITGEECDRAKKAPLGVTWHEFPRSAPHVAMRYQHLARSGEHVRTTLDMAVQDMVQQCLSDEIEAYAPAVTNAACIVVDTRSGRVLAHAGSANFFDTPGGGQVDACRAPRSPGSTLKPFTYALAIERNLLYPSEMLLDSTLDYGRYVPENFDGTFNGMITASDALRASLNVPAVMVLNRVNADALLTFLHSAGMSTLQWPAEYYGLGLTLGNCETRLDELAAAYAMVARLGTWRPLQYLDGERPGAARHCLQRGTCLALYEMLCQPFPDEFRGSQVLASASATPVAWKTGTSANQRDAWTFVFNQHYVVGVWMGNNDGSGSGFLVGRESALPLAARIFRRLPARTDPPPWPAPGNDLRTASVCAVSGLPATPWCPHRRSALLPHSQYLNRQCDVHYPSADGHGVVARWPGSARSWDLAAITSPMPARRATEQAASPTAPATRERIERLRITAPAESAEFLLTRVKNGDRVRLHASTEQEGPLHWYLNESYLGESRPNAPLYLDLVPGDHRLACMDNGGAWDDVRFTVTVPERDYALVN